MDTKIAIYYRDLPAAIETCVRDDGHAKMVKDGVYPFKNHNVPRASIFVEKINPFVDKERLEKITSLLEELEHNNQILAFAVY